MSPPGRGWFVTGTDTGVGKTQVACGLLACLRRRGLSVGVYKPAETGCPEVDGRLRGDDAVRLQTAAGAGQPLDSVTAALYAEPAAPLVAAENAGDTLSLERLAEGHRRVAEAYDRVLVEGAGGLLVPVAEGVTFADLARELKLPVLCVVGSRLGCINHALLTLDALATRRIPVAGWILNELDAAPEERLAHQTHRAVLERFAPAPCLGTLPPLPAADRDDPSRLADWFESGVETRRLLDAG
ncbi:MAG: dethiobiotin synthase [Myxococcota bacterium]